ncbi:NACHT domain-containing protein [Streptomyces odontomachi]|uniref:NACHT domain-containing protein n=1 Tax=Streptomyces odontomachi TaxID=2944940 RepID=UPI002109DA74|nr:NACHT domain-containing protein [Streptomyces sp. ODS25]
MEPAVLGSRLASSLMSTLIKKLFVAEAPGAGLVDQPVRISRLVSFRGEKRTLTLADVRKIAATLVGRAVGGPGERPFPSDEDDLVTERLTWALAGLGDLDMDDVHAVRLGHRELARELLTRSPAAELSEDAALFVRSATEWACLHILHFFTQRSTFVARTLVEQSRGQAELIAKVDELIRRTPRPDHHDTAFERRYRAYLTTRHGKLTIYGIDLSNSPGKWPLDTAYLSLEATSPSGAVVGAGGDHALDARGHRTTSPGPSPADQALAAHERVLLRGVAGSGKTTLVQWLAVSAAADDPGDRMTYLHGLVPFVLPLRTLTRHGERLPAPAGFLSAVGSPLAGAQPPGWETRVLTAGRGLLLVDGIDEVPEAERGRARAWLSELVDAFPGNRWLVTSRPSAVRENWLADDRFTELTLTAMNLSDVTAFVRRWHTAARTGDPDEDTRLAAYETQLLDAVRAKPDLGRLATNPLMCGLICALHRDRRGYLPHGRRELYEAALSMLLTRRDRERDMAGPELSEEPQLQLLQRLAYWLIRNGRTELDRERAERIIAEGLPAVPAARTLGAAPDVLRHFLVRTGLLREPAPGAVDFVHRTFQDHLGARAAVEAGDFGLLAAHATDDQWADVIRMAVAQGRPRERAELLGLLLEAGDAAPDRHTRARTWLLAMACLEHATELAPGVRAEVEDRAALLIPPRSDEEARSLAALGPLVLELLPGPAGLSADEARRVVGTAGLIGTDAALPVLAQFSSHPDMDVRIHLGRAWGRVDVDQYAGEVLTHVDSDDFFIEVKSAEMLRALRFLGDRAKITVYGSFEASELAAALPPGCRELVVADNPDIRSLAPLTELRSLERLGLYECPNIADLMPLVELGLKSLNLLGLDETIPGLRELTTLRMLDVRQPLPAGLLESLPVDAALTSICLSSGAFSARGLRGLSHWATLEDLTLIEAGNPLTAWDWAEMAQLPSLTGLSLDSGLLSPRITVHAPALPSLRKLRLYQADDGMDPSDLPRIFPGLRVIRLLPPRSTSVDVTRYARLFPDAEITVSEPKPWLL